MPLCGCIWWALITHWRYVTFWMQMLDPVFAICRLQSQLRHAKCLPNCSGPASGDDAKQHPHKKIKLTSSTSFVSNGSPISAEVCYLIPSFFLKWGFYFSGNTWLSISLALPNWLIVGGLRRDDRMLSLEIYTAKWMSGYRGQLWFKIRGLSSMQNKLINYVEYWSPLYQLVAFTD